MADFDWKKPDDKNGINLLPDELRQKEAKELASAPEQQIELRQPKKADTAVPEGKVPWFSFRSWFSRQPKEKKPPVKDDKPEQPKRKFYFRLIPRRKRQEQEELERAKEEALRQHIIREVFEKKGLPLPENDNSLFNRERREKQRDLESQIGDMDIEGKPAAAAAVAPEKASPKPAEPLSQELPELPPELPRPLSLVAASTPSVEPVTPDLPNVQAVSQKPVADQAPPVPPPAAAPMPESDQMPDKPAAKGFHIPAGIFASAAKTAPRPKSRFGVNLIPSSITVRNWSQLRAVFGTTVILTLVAWAAVYGGLLWWDREIERQTAAIDAKIQTAESAILKFQSLKDQIVATENQIRDIESLLGKHIYWTQFFSLLEAYTVNDVYFDRFAAGVNGNLSLNAHGKDYLTAARQLKLLQSAEAKEFVASASINSVQDTDEGVTFTIDLQLNDRLLYYSHASTTQQ